MDAFNTAPDSLQALSDQVPHTIWQVVEVIKGVIQETHEVQPYDIYSIDFQDPALYYTAASIFVAGVLASAAGIGGGGIFVAVLMVAANFSPHQAVPLSKALIFSGAVMSFMVNVRKRDNRGQRLIQLELVKNIVPMALGGTLFGVMLNAYTPRAVLVLCLAFLLVIMTLKLLSQAIKSYRQESALIAASAERCPAKEFNDTHSESVTTAGSEFEHQQFFFQERNLVTRSTFSVYRDVVLMILCLAAVISCGSARTYFPDYSWTPNLILGSGLLFCMIVTWLFRGTFMSPAGLTTGDDDRVSLSYPLVAVFAGVCSGLMGIGGGLIFAPFLLMSGIEPSKAVVTSATCVIFTATSTTMQYLFLGRIMIYHALFLGGVSFLASICGTKLIHFIKDNGRSSYLVFIVAFAIGISCVLMMLKGIKFAEEDWPRIHYHIAFGYWVAQISAALMWKLTTSMDDVMWLSPFLAQTRNKLMPTLFKLLVYIIVVQCVVWFAASVVWGSDYLSKKLSEGGHTINIHAYLLLCSGSLLSCYAMFLLREWYQEKFGDQDGEGDGDEADDEPHQKELTINRLIIVAFLGQLDELASFTTALLGGFFAPLSLSIGCLFACAAIASMCVGALKIRYIAECILSVPVWGIIGALSIYNICNGLSALLSP